MVEDHRACSGISRRTFVSGATAAGACLALSPLLIEEVTAQTQIQTAPAATAAPLARIRLHVNGRDHDLSVKPRVTLLDALREGLKLTGTKKGCDHGQCGACTVLVDGRRTLSCLTLAVMHQAAKIQTIEGVAPDGGLHPLQAAFIEHDGFQCGFCTPGQIMSAIGLAHEGHARTAEEIREQMSGNLCRCGAYAGIVAAIRTVLEEKSRAAV